ncbi:PEBP-like protein [Lojkania enalia]|uniref:PEBP-like protein n=1 Tax=Lojkania enalia TaxID=147567 RepID=A0A9P4N9Y2_9PLEO|nr:PEBP-like protein [Didymosphaeria enalia]
MYITSSALFAALVSFAQAQTTPQGFSPSVNTMLPVIFNSTSVSTPGQQLTIAETAQQPQLALSSSDVSSSDTYMFIMVDLDIPPMGNSTSRNTLLHAMITDFKATSQTLTDSSVLLTSQQIGPAAYIGPAPPETDTVAHRYVELLFQQPSTLQVSADDFQEVSDRIGFDVSSFMEENGLSEPVAGNFFTVDPRAGNNATATSTGGIVMNTLQPFEGVAVEKKVSLGLVGLLGGLALLLV